MPQYEIRDDWEVEEVSEDEKKTVIQELINAPRSQHNEMLDSVTKKTLGRDFKDIKSKDPELARIARKTFIETLRSGEVWELWFNKEAILAKISHALKLYGEYLDRQHYRRDQSFTCRVCFDDLNEGEPYVSVSGDPVCRDCYIDGIRPRFIAALQDEVNWPVTWGSAILKPDGFPELPDGLMESWQEQEAMYEVPLAERLCCQHYYFVKPNGTRQAPVSRQEYEAKRRAGTEARECGYFFGSQKYLIGVEVQCQRCFGMMCGSCGQALEEFEAKHDCQPSRFANALNISPDLVRGADYQECPACGRRFALGDGCNQLTCQCRTPFCFLCGAKAHHNSDHWAPGKPCPRFGMSGSKKALHDEGDDLLPLVIAQHYQDIAERLRGQAEKTGKPAKWRRAKLDQAIIAEQLGLCEARRQRRELQDREQDRFLIIQFVGWIPAMEKLLSDMEVMAEVYVYRELVLKGKDKPPYTHAERFEKLKKFVELRPKIEQAMERFDSRHPGVLDLMPEVMPLFRRIMAISETEIAAMKAAK